MTKENLSACVFPDLFQRSLLHGNKRCYKKDDCTKMGEREREARGLNDEEISAPTCQKLSQGCILEAVSSSGKPN